MWPSGLAVLVIKTLLQKLVLHLVFGDDITLYNLPICPGLLDGENMIMEPAILWDAVHYYVLSHAPGNMSVSATFLAVRISQLQIVVRPCVKPGALLT